MFRRLLPLLTLLAAPAVAHEGHGLPLGDGRLSAAPAQGHVMACPGRPAQGAGAQAPGPWIRGTAWFPEEKPRVEGEVAWPAARIEVTVEGAERVLRLNRLPLHETGEFPIRPGSEAHRHDRNPNAIRAAEVVMRIPAAPEPAARPHCIGLGPVGWTLSGAALFGPFDERGRDAAAWEVQDLCQGHPERGGIYHYHHWSDCLGRLAAGPDAPVGWMLDGFPILGPVDGATGREVTNADLDGCHGRTGPVEVEPGRVVVTYHYRFTREFPYTIGCFRGTPVPIR